MVIILYYFWSTFPLVLKPVCRDYSSFTSSTQLFLNYLKNVQKLKYLGVQITYGSRVSSGARKDNFGAMNFLKIFHELFCSKNWS